MYGAMSFVWIPYVIGAILLTGLGNVLLLLVLRQLRVDTLQFDILKRMAIGHMMYSLVFGAPFLASLFGRTNIFTIESNLPCSVVGAVSDAFNCFLVFELLFYTIERYYIIKDDALPVRLNNHQRIIHLVPVALSTFFSMFLLFDRNSYFLSQDLNRCSWFVARIPFVMSLFTWVPSTFLAVILTIKMLHVSLRIRNTTRVMPFIASDTTRSSEHKSQTTSSNDRTNHTKVFSITTSSSLPNVPVTGGTRPLKVFTTTTSCKLEDKNTLIHGRTRANLIRRSLLASFLSAPLLTIQIVQFALQIAQETDKENKTTYGNIITALVFCRGFIYPCLVLLRNRSMLMALKKLLCCNNTTVQSPRHSFQRVFQHPPRPREEISIQLEELPHALRNGGSMSEAKQSNPKRAKRWSSVRLSSVSSNKSSITTTVLSTHHVTSCKGSSSSTADSVTVTVHGRPASSIVSTVQTSSKSSSRSTISLGDLRIYQKSY